MTPRKLSVPLGQIPRPGLLTGVRRFLLGDRVKQARVSDHGAFRRGLGRAWAIPMTLVFSSGALITLGQKQIAVLVGQVQQHQSRPHCTIAYRLRAPANIAAVAKVRSAPVRDSTAYGVNARRARVRRRPTDSARVLQCSCPQSTNRAQLPHGALAALVLVEEDETGSGGGGAKCSRLPLHPTWAVLR
jgi:hypothetical protein